MSLLPRFSISGMTNQSTLVELAPGRWAHPSGALWLPQLRTALLADVHLGYGWALRRRGQLGPVQDGGLRRKLLSIAEELRPASLVFLGDLVHAPRPTMQEREFVVSVLRELAANTELICVRGNHDRGFERDYPELALTLVPEWSGAGLLAMHGDRIPASVDGHLTVGHLHPALGIVDDAGASQKVPVFLTGERATVLPAFSTLAAGFDVRSRLPDDLLAWFQSSEPCVVAATGKRVVRLGSLARLRQT